MGIFERGGFYAKLNASLSKSTSTCLVNGTDGTCMPASVKYIKAKKHELVTVCKILNKKILGQASVGLVGED